ncbi:uncharacterized protein SCHCODRAFT_02630516 [Schizophyllum commune H4-8]|uniref:uncharacterized protein n=1 Tax=Schizophyllum commune (strain H4-8 / FGSC 9210) TaxID=578458 RepID=UPI00215E8352|nr:uncharacterized protein SCHCODRAFT_02630516 [Schizophyllum commune H4-8]KAI5889970.1 hypothetical protein SCHCODRAFT_02630516 [Schizophyllum commune H4-8]
MIISLAGLPSPPSHEPTYGADPEHDEPNILRYPNEEPQAYPPDEPATYPEDEDPFYPPAPRSPSSTSARFAFRNPSAAPRDPSPAPREPSPAPRVPPQGPFIAPPLPGSPRFALDAYTFGEPSRGPILPDPVSPRSRTPPVPSSARRGGSSDGRRVVPSQDPRRGIVPSNALYTPFYPSPSSRAPEPYTRAPEPYTRSPEPYLYSLAGHNAPTVPSQRGAPTSHHSQWPEDSGYDAPPHASTSYAARASTSYAPDVGPSHHAPQSPSRYEPRQASTSYDLPQASTSYAPASTSRVPPLAPAQWIPRPPRSPYPQHPQRPAEDYILPPLRLPTEHRAPAASTPQQPAAPAARHPVASTSYAAYPAHSYPAHAYPATYPDEPSTIGHHVPRDTVAFITEYFGSDRQTLVWGAADQFWRQRAEARQSRHDADGSELQIMREALESMGRRLAEAEALSESRRVELEEEREETRALRETNRELRQRVQDVEEMAANLATGSQEREQDLLRANRSMARQLHAHGIVPEIDQVEESVSEDEVVTPGGPNSQAEDVTIVEPNTVVDGFTPVAEFDPVDEALEAEDDLEYADDLDADDEFEVTTPVQATTTVQVSTPVEATAPVEATIPDEVTTPMQRWPALAPSHSTLSLPPASYPSPAEGPAPRTSETPVPGPSRSTQASASPRASPKPASQRSSPRLASRRSSPRHASPRPSPRLASPYARPASASSQRSPSPAQPSSPAFRPFASSMMSVAPHAMRSRRGAPLMIQAYAAESLEEEQDEDEPAIKVEPEEEDELVVKLEPEEETLPSRRSSVASSSRAA